MAAGMGFALPVIDFSYFERQLAYREEREGSNTLPGSARRRRSEHEYLADGTGEGRGKGYHFRSAVMGDRHFFKGLIENDEYLNAHVVMELAKGKNPHTGEELRKSFKSKGKGDQHRMQRAGIEFTPAPPKSISALWAAAETRTHMLTNEELLVAEHGYGTNSPFGDPGKVADAIVKAHDEAVKKMMDWLCANYLITRIVPDEAKNRKHLVNVHLGEVAGGSFGHLLTRSGDPQIHTHVVLFNLVVLPDGRVRTLDSQEAMKYQACAKALYNAHLASGLKKSLGIEVEAEKEWFEIAGFPKEVIKNFSKRREDMERIAKEHGKDLSNPDVARFVALASRGKKDEVPPISDLIPLWHNELEGLGWDYDRLISAIQIASEKKQIEVQKNPVDLMKIAKEVLDDLTKTESAIPEPTLMRRYWERLEVVGLDFDECLQAFEDIKKSPLVKVCGYNEVDGSPYFTTPEIEQVERRMLARAKSLKDIHHSTFVPEEITESLIDAKQRITGDLAIDVLDRLNDVVNLVRDDLSAETRRDVGRIRERMTKKGVISERHLAPVRDALENLVNSDGLDDEKKAVVTDFLKNLPPLMSIEQSAVVRAALGKSGVTIIQGRAGAGKTYSMKSAVQAIEAAGKKVFVIAPSWRATDVAMKETEIAEEMSRAVTGFLARVEKGEFELDPNFSIICDEFGMVGLHHADALVGLATATGCRFVGVGDTRQLAPVPCGSPMRALTKVIGDTTISKVRRQRLAWQRLASEGFTTGRAKEALGEYDIHGCFDWCDDAQTAKEHLVASYMSSVRMDMEAIAAKERKHQRSRVVIAVTNQEVRELNELIREELRKLGLIGPEDEEVLIDCIVRGQNAPVLPVGFVSGDQIILGETIELNGVRFPNGSIGTIQSIWRSKETDEAYITIAFDDGKKTGTFRESDFYAHRKDGDEPLCPKLQHAFATTVYASQGMTTDQALVLNTRRMSLELSYVAMTRHRDDLQVFVDTERVHDTLASRRSGKTFLMSKDAYAKNEQPGDEDAPVADKQATAAKEAETESEDTPSVTLEDIKAKVFGEMSHSELKLNVSDWQENVPAWCEGADHMRPQIERYEVQYVPEEQGDQSSGSSTALTPSDATVKSEVTPDLSLQVSDVSFSENEKGVDGTKRKKKRKTPIADRARSDAPRALPNTLGMNSKELNQLLDEIQGVEGVGAGKMAERKFKKHVSAAPSRVTDNPLWSEPPIRPEDERVFETTNLIDFLGGRLYDHPEYRRAGTAYNHGTPIGIRHDFRLDSTSGPHIVINECDDGTWSFWMTKSGETGRGVDGFVAFDGGLSMSDKWERILAKKIARDQLGIKVSRDGKSTITPYVAPERQMVPQKPLIERLRDGWRNTQNYDEYYDPENYRGGSRRTRREVISYHNKTWREATKTTCDDNATTSEYLLHTRGIIRDTQRHFARDIAIYQRKYGDNKTEDIRVMFALRHFPRNETEYPPVIGYAMKGMKKPGDERSPSKNTTANAGGLHLMGNLKTKPSVIIAGESAISAMSYWQQLPEHLKKDALIISTTGQTSWEMKVALFHYAELYPDAPIHLTYDRDLAGDKMFAEAADTVALARPEGQQAIDCRTDPRFNDWNDQLLGKEMSEEKKAKIEAERKAYADKLRGEWEAALYRRAENSLAEKFAAAVDANPEFNMLGHERQAYIDSFIQFAKAGIDNPDVKLIPEKLVGPEVDQDGINKHRVTTPPSQTRRTPPPPPRPVQPKHEPETPEVSGPGMSR